MEREMKFATKCVHAAERPDPIFGAHTTPIFQTSTFIFENSRQGAARFAGEEDGYVYARIPPNTPTNAVLAEKFAALEGRGGRADFCLRNGSNHRRFAHHPEAGKPPNLNGRSIRLYLQSFFRDFTEAWNRCQFC